MTERCGCAKAGIEIRFVKSWPAQQILALYAAGGWLDGSETKSFVKKVVAGSFVFAVAVDKESGKAVGMGRVLSDGVSDAYIQEVVVLPECRRRNVGKKLIVALRDYCLKKKIMWIALVAEPGTEGFYRDLGFKRLDDYSPMRFMV
jgi:ribosomal protein S18 acetylase RimI-like enzyme